MSLCVGTGQALREFLPGLSWVCPTGRGIAVKGGVDAGGAKQRTSKGKEVDEGCADISAAFEDTCEAGNH